VGVCACQKLAQEKRKAVKQYELYWAKLPAPIGRRPVLLLTRTAAYDYLTNVIVVEITSTIRGIAQEVPLGPREGLTQRSVANFDNFHVVPKHLLSEKIGAVAASRIWEVKRALGYTLDWAELKVHKD
jgi:mRNA interferase MazF